MTDMKKLMIVPAAFLFAGMTAHAQSAVYTMSKGSSAKETKAEKKEAKKELQEAEGFQPGVLVKDNFYADFGERNVKWQRTKYFDEARFVRDGKQTTAYYDADASLVGTTVPAKFIELPKAARDYIRKHYKGYAIGDALLFDDNEANFSDMMLYDSVAGDEDNYFVELTKGGKTIVLKVDTAGAVSYFTEKRS